MVLREHASGRFGSTDHLSAEAVAAYVDGELSMTAHLRAGRHLADCDQCRADVDAQRQARGVIRRCGCGSPGMPDSLRGLLAAIPNAAPDADDQPAAPAHGLAGLLGRIARGHRRG